jgi:hypothetical protein
MQLTCEAGPPCSCPQPLRHASARELCRPAWWRPGRRACAPSSVPARAPPAHAALAPDQGAGAPRQQRRAGRQCWTQEAWRGGGSLRRARMPQQAARQPRPPLPCRHTARSAARAIAAAATQPASHASRQLQLLPGLPLLAAARPCHLCALLQLRPEPIHLATSRPHGHSAAVARGSMCVQERQTRCMQGLSPRRARRAGRVPAPLCAQQPRRARPPRR